MMASIIPLVLAVGLLAMSAGIIISTSLLPPPERRGHAAMGRIVLLKRIELVELLSHHCSSRR